MGKAEGKVSEEIPGHWSSVLKGRERDQAPGTGRRALRAEQKARAGGEGALPCRALWPGDSPELWVSVRAWRGGGLQAVWSGVFPTRPLGWLVHHTGEVALLPFVTCATRAEVWPGKVPPPRWGGLGPEWTQRGHQELWPERRRGLGPAP